MFSLVFRGSGRRSETVGDGRDAVGRWLEHTFFHEAVGGSWVILGPEMKVQAFRKSVNLEP